MVLAAVDFAVVLAVMADGLVGCGVGCGRFGCGFGGCGVGGCGVGGDGFVLAGGCGAGGCGLGRLLII